MQRDEFLEAFSIQTGYQPGDLEEEAPLQFDADKALENAPEGETQVSAARSPWIATRPSGNSIIPEVYSPRLADLASQDWLGGSSRDEYSARARRFGPLVGEALGDMPDFDPTPEQIVDTANSWGLDERFYDRLADARSPEDMEALAEAHAGRMQREARIADSGNGFTNFVARTAVNVFDPAFVLSGGAAGAVLKVGSGATRLGNAMRGAGVGLADAPGELARMNMDPAIGWQETTIAIMGSTALSGALGSLARGVGAEDIQALDRAAAEALEGQTALSSSVGAAQARPVLREMEDGTFEVEGAPGRAEFKIPGTQWGIGIFGTPLNFLQRSTDSITRDLGARLSWNPFSGSAQRQTAAEAQRRIYESGASFVREHRDAAAAYWKRQGRLSPTGAPSTEQIEQFNTLVAQVMVGARRSDDVDVLRAAKVWSNFHQDTLSYVKNEFYNGGRATAGQGRGLEEFAEIEHDPTYLMRMFSEDGFRKVLNTSGGIDGVAKKLQRVILRSNQKYLKDLADKWNAGRSNTPDATGRIRRPMTEGEMALRIAKKYVQTVSRLTNPAQRGTGSPHKPVTKADRDAAREIAREVFNEGDEFAENIEDAIDMVMDLLTPSAKKSKESARARNRMTLNLDVELDADIIDMFDWNVERLGMTYRRQLSGYAGFLRAGFNSVAEFNSSVQKIRDNSLSGDAGRQKRAGSEADRLEVMRDMLLGRAEERQLGTDNYNFVMNQIRRLNFGALMNNTGFLAISELAGAVTRVGPIRLFKQLPEFRKYLEQARKGDPEAKESIFYLADAINGQGTHQLRSRLAGRVDRYEGDFEELGSTEGRIKEKIDTFTRKQANAVSRFSGMAPLTEFLRMSIVSAEAQDWLKAARKGKALYEPRRMRALGVDEEMAERITAQLRRMEDATSPDTGRKIGDFDLNKWDDPEALNVFLNAIDRNSRRLVLEGDLGGQALIMRRSPALQLLFQFLGFPLNAFSKHLGFALNVRDARSAAEVIAMSFGGAMGYTARVLAQAGALDEEGEREEFLAERLTYGEMAKASFYYSAHASLAPNLIDLPLSLADQAGFDVEPIFSKSRASGLAGDPLMGNATRSRLYRSVRSTGDLFTGTPMSEQDVQEFVTANAPLAQHVAAQAFLNRALEFLPEEEED
jgi:hypothetical protein